MTITGVRIVFVLSPYQNAFFTEIAEALGEALSAHGVESLIVREPASHVPGSDDVFVLLPPHEYVALEGDGFLADAAVAGRTVGISVEQPTEVHFPMNVEVARGLAATLDFSPTSVAAYRDLGVDAVHLSFGHVPSWDRFGAEPGTEQDGRRRRRTSVLYLGNNRARRLGVFAESADLLARHATTLVVADRSEPNRLDDPWFFVGDRKRDLLADTDVLVNVHQRPGQYFEWLRFTEAAHCGATVLTEKSLETEPFVDGEHFVSFDVDDFGSELETLLGDPERREMLAGDAYSRLLETPLAESVRSLIAVARDVCSRSPTPDALPPRTRVEPIGRDRSDLVARNSWRPTRQRFSRVRQRQSAPDWELVAPTDTVLRSSIDDVVAASAPTAAGGAAFINVMASGHDRQGAPMLEGLWPWQPWRLRHGQHLGRVLLVPPALQVAARRWLPDAAFDEMPALRIQLFAAVHGVAGGHVAAPHAALTAIVDPTHVLSDDVATRCREILGVR